MVLRVECSYQEATTPGDRASLRCIIRLTPFRIDLDQQSSYR